MTGRHDQDPGQAPSTGEELLADLLQTGNLLDQHQAQADALDADRAGINERRAALEAEREAAERQVVDDFNAKAGKLGEEAVRLQDEERRLIQRRGRAQGKATKLGNKLRDLATKPDVDRPTLMAYAAFAATKSDFTSEAVAAVTALDEHVRETAGEPFVIIQGRSLTFGRIEDETEGLIVDTNKDTHRTNVVDLPTSTTNVVKHSRRSPHFGWVSGYFDHPRDLYETYDSVLKRRAEAEDLINGDSGWSAMSHFNLERGNVPLFRPAKIQIAESAEDFPVGDPGEEDEGFWQHQDVLFTGETANRFFHRVIDARITLLERELDTDQATAEFGRLSAVTARLGMSVDAAEVPVHQRLISI